MKYPTGILGTGSLLAVLVLSGCDNASNRMESAEISVIEANRDMEIAKSEVEAELQIYRAENDDRMTEYSKTIEDIKDKISKETDLEVRDRLEIQLVRHEGTHNKLQRDMENYKASGRENWDDFKIGFNNSMDDLEDSLDNFFADSRTSSSSN